MFSPLIFSNTSLRNRCLGGNSTAKVMMQHQVSAWVLTWCWYPVAVLIMHQMCDSLQIYVSIIAQYEAEYIIYQLSLSRAARGEFWAKVTQERGFFALLGFNFLFVIRTWCIQVQNHSVLAPWKTLCGFFFLFKEIFIYNNTNATPPPQKKTKTLKWDKERD